MAFFARVREKLTESFASMDALASRVGHNAVTLAVWPLLYASAVGAGGFILRHPSWVPLLDTNKVPKADTYKLAIAIGVAAGAILLVYGAVLLASLIVARRKARPRRSALALVAELNRRLRFLLAVPLLPALTLANIERDSPKETYFLIVLIAAIGGFAAYAWLPPAPPLLGSEASDTASEASHVAAANDERVRSALAFAAVLGLWAGYGYFFSRFSITNHHALRTSTVDLGLYDNIFYQSAHGHPLGCSFIKGGGHGSAHFDPILVLLSPLYLLYPRAEFLLALQSIWLGAGVVPAYLLARHKLDSRVAGLAFAVMYAIYPALHGANMYDFHSLSLLSPLALLLIYFLETGRMRSYWALLLPVLLVREDIAILLCFVGAYAILTRRPGSARVGWVTILAAFSYFALAKRVFMKSVDVFNSGDGSYSFAYYYDDLIPNHNGVAGFFISIFTNPVFLMKTALSEPKVLYLLALFVPLAFLPLLARPGRILLGWGLFFSLCASRSAVFSTHFQYSSLIIPMAFAAAPAALKQIEEGPFVRARALDGARVWRAVLVSSFVASLLVSWKFGGILENATFHGGFGAAAHSLSPKERETYEWLRAEVAKIPGDASVASTNHTGAHVSNRLKAYHYSDHGNTDWIVVDDNELHGGELDRHTKALKDGVIELVSKHDRLAIYRRKTAKP